MLRNQTSTAIRREASTAIHLILYRRRVSVLTLWKFRSRDLALRGKIANSPERNAIKWRRPNVSPATENVFPAVASGIVNALADLIPESWLPRDLSRLAFGFILALLAWNTAIGAISTLLHGALFCGLAYGGLKAGSSNGDNELLHLCDRIDEFMNNCTPFAKTFVDRGRGPRNNR